MSDNPFHCRFEDLPRVLPIFPLTGALLLPHGRLPLNIFEPRFLAMALDALGFGRMIGMIQPMAGEGDGGLYDIGCAGRISAFSETADGRLLVTLTGVIRFRLGQEIESVRGYRRIMPDYEPFRADLSDEGGDAQIERDRLLLCLRPYFQRRKIEADWSMVENASNAALVTSLAMICPLEPREKQALLEAQTLAERAGALITMLEIAVMEGETRATETRN